MIKYNAPNLKKRKKYGRRPKKKPDILKIKHGADPQVKKVLKSIGVPEKKPFTPDSFQLEAVDAINRSDCLVTAPTGSGKTWIAVETIKRVRDKGGRAWYASPLKALSYAKHKEFSIIFGEKNTGILTGDVKENPDAPVIVGTTEILRNQLYDAMHHGKTLPTDLVILDEAHYLGDEERGVVWEEVIIYLPQRIPLLLLSATIGNALQIAKWIEKIRSKKCCVVEEKKRPVPLYPIFFHPSGMLLPLVSPAKKKRGVKISKKVQNYLNTDNPPLLSLPRKLPPFDGIIRVLRKYNLLPAIFFLKSRNDCDNALSMCTLSVSEERKETLSKRIDELIPQNSHISRHGQLWSLENMAMGVHHSGQLPAWKLIIETLMTEGMLDAVFATSTVAAGVNFPARTIVMLNSDRFNGKEFLTLTSTEFHQMTGRAGRRGMDNIGFAVILPGKFMNVPIAAKLVTAAPSDVFSQIKINFSMVLNLLLSHTPNQISDLLKKSFASYLISKSDKVKKFKGYGYNNIAKEFTRHLSFLKETGYVTKEGKLTHDGIWTSQLRIDLPLMVSQGFRYNVLPDSDPALFAAVISMFVYEQEFDDSRHEKTAPKELVQACLTVKRALKPFQKLMDKRGFKTKDMFLHPAFIIYQWAQGVPWEKVVSISEMAEGNLAMLILRTADNLKHIKTLKQIFPVAAKTSEKSIDLILKEPVVMDYDPIPKE